MRFRDILHYMLHILSEPIRCLEFRKQKCVNKQRWSNDQKKTSSKKLKNITGGSWIWEATHVFTPTLNHEKKVFFYNESNISVVARTSIRPRILQLSQQQEYQVIFVVFAKMEYLADIIWLALRCRPHSDTHTHTAQEINHNLLCQPHNKTISELNGAGVRDEQT